MFHMQTRENRKENFKNPKTLRVPARIRGSHAGGSVGLNKKKTQNEYETVTYTATGSDQAEIP